MTQPIAVIPKRRRRSTMAADVELIGWAAEQLGVAESTAYRLADAGELPGAFKVGGQWRVSVPRFWAAVHGDEVAEGVSASGGAA